MRYRCPKCKRYGMQWDARAKVLMCYYNTCNYVIRMGSRTSIPSEEETCAAIGRDATQVQNTTLDDIIPVA